MEQKITCGGFSSGMIGLLCEWIAMYLKPRVLSKTPSFASFSEISDKNGRIKIVRAFSVSYRCFSNRMSPTKLLPALVGAENIKLSKMVSYR